MMDEGANRAVIGVRSLGLEMLLVAGRATVQSALCGGTEVRLVVSVVA